MASNNISSQQKLVARKSFSVERIRPSKLLKDHLLDDLSSCSSNGFKSLPRRQCCTTVRFLLDKDLKAKESTKTNRLVGLRRSRSSRAALSTISALQKASEAVIKAVKLFPFPSMKSTSQKRAKSSKKGVLPRSLSPKMLSRSFWKKAVKEDGSDIGRWRFLRKLLEESDKPLDQNTQPSTMTTTNISSAIVEGRFSTSMSNSNTNSWMESEFSNSEIVRSYSSGNSESSSDNDVVQSKEEVIFPAAETEKVSICNSKREGVIVGEDSVEEVTTTTTTCSQSNTKEWSNEEKEQFSPVSVLDCPFEDEEEEEEEEEEDINSSTFHPKISSLEGKNHKLIKKIRRFEGFALLEAVELEKRMVLSEWEDESPIQSFSFSMSAQDSYDNIVVNCERNETTTNQTEVRELFNLFKKMTSPSNSLMVKADNLLFDFFRESVEEVEKKAKEVQVLKVAQEWFNGQPQELYLGWEVMDGRTACIKDMEKSGRWMKFDEENEQVALGLEVDVFNCLVNELIVDLVLISLTKLVG